MSVALLPALAVGFVVGFRHAFEPDHLAAVTTLATRERGWSHAARLGVAWGIGHTASVALVALVLIVLGIHVPERFFATAELGVAVLLVGLGVGGIAMEWRRHRTGLGAGHALAHANHQAHAHPAAVRTSASALGFGVAHGLAGSGAVIVLLVAASSRRDEQLGYLLAFGVGTIAGMGLVSLLTGAVTGVVGRRHAGAARWVRLGASVASIAIGLLLGAEVLSG